LSVPDARIGDRHQNRRASGPRRSRAKPEGEVRVVVSEIRARMSRPPRGCTGRASRSRRSASNSLRATRSRKPQSRPLIVGFPAPAAVGATASYGPVRVRNVFATRPKLCDPLTPSPRKRVFSRPLTSPTGARKAWRDTQITNGDVCSTRPPSTGPVAADPSPTLAGKPVCRRQTVVRQLRRAEPVETLQPTPAGRFTRSAGPIPKGPAGFVLLSSRGP